jgi:hypothetical protein
MKPIRFIPPVIGERILVERMEEIPTKISKVEWVESEYGYKISLDWGEFGTSYVWGHDEGTVWKRYFNVN